MKKAIIHLGKKPDESLSTIKTHSSSVLANYGQSVLVLAEDDGLQALKAAGYRVRELSDKTKIKIRGFQVDTEHPAVRSTTITALDMDRPLGRSHVLLKFIGPIHQDWKSQLMRMGVTFYQSFNDNVHLIGVNSDKIDDIQSFDYVESVSIYHPTLKISQSLLSKEILGEMYSDAVNPIDIEITEDEKTEPIENIDIFSLPEETDDDKAGNMEIMLFEPDISTTINAIKALGAKIIQVSSLKIIINANRVLIPKLAEISNVRKISAYTPERLHNDVSRGIVNADILQNNHGLDGSGQTIGIADSGLDTGVNDNSMLADFRGRITSIYALGRPGTPGDPTDPPDASDTDNHGTHVAGSALGNGVNSNGFITGMAPAANLVFQSTMDAVGDLSGIPANIEDLFDVAYNDGARIHSNSWGARLNGEYNGRAWDVDDYTFNNRDFLVLYSAGNEGYQVQNRIGAPGTAKNVLTVGASEGVRPLPAICRFPNSPLFPVADFPNGPEWQDITDQPLRDPADNANHVAGLSSIGPAENNRRKPDVVAPGTWILSTRSSVSVYDSGGLGGNNDGWRITGDEDDNPTHPEAVKLGLPGQPIKFAGDQNTPAAPAGSGAAVAQNYCYNWGTSMSTPIAAGACALVRQYLIEQRGHTPSAVLIKALIISGAVDMGMGVHDNGQGWGRVDLDNTLFPPSTRRIQFDDTLDNALVTGDIHQYDIFVSSIADPLMVTLVWRDPPGDTIQNRLHLRVTHVSSNTVITSDDITNILNNVQKVIVDPPKLGQYLIEVEGDNVDTGIPEFRVTDTNPPRQDYALVVANAIGYSCNPSDIVQVIDRSGSMRTSGYIEPAKERAKHMIDILQINDKAGVVTFASSANEVYPLTPIDSQEEKEDAHAVIDPVTASGMTDLREALSQGMTTLGTDIGRPRAIVFLSDGKHTVSTPEIDESFLNTLVAANIKVYTIALGPASDFAVLDEIADQTGTGDVFTVESAADLHKLHEIYYDIIGSMGCGGVVHLNSASIESNDSNQSAYLDETTNEALFAVSWESTDSEFEFKIKDPSGNTIDSSSNRAHYYQGSTHQFYRVANPEPGLWRMLIQTKSSIPDQTQKVTTAVLANHDISVKIKLDPKYLYDNKVLLSLKASYKEKPLIGGKAIASITYPTVSIDALLNKYEDELKKYPLDIEKLAKDKDDLNLIKLGLLATQYQNEGKDIFERKTIEIELRDDGRDKDPKPNDGVYTTFFDPQKAGVAGNFRMQVQFKVQSEEIGTHTSTKLIPVYVPQIADGIKPPIDGRPNDLLKILISLLILITGYLGYVNLFKDIMMSFIAGVGFLISTGLLLLLRNVSNDKTNKT